VLTANGSGFINSSTVQWSGPALNTTYVSGTQLQAALPASDLNTTGSFNVTVVNPEGAEPNDTSGGRTSPIPHNELSNDRRICWGRPGATSSAEQEFKIHRSFRRHATLLERRRRRMGLESRVASRRDYMELSHDASEPISLRRTRTGRSQLDRASAALPYGRMVRVEPQHRQISPQTGSSRVRQ
jgi:hypothetical protein